MLRGVTVMLSGVFSTSVEVFLGQWKGTGVQVGLLHVRGGVSQASRMIGGSSVSSPRPWRCFCNPFGDGAYNTVFSTSVEVFLNDPIV